MGILYGRKVQTPSPHERPQGAQKPRAGLDIPGAITATLGISTLVFGIIQGGEEGWFSPLILASFAVSATLLAAFVRIELTAEHPMLPLRFFKNKS